MKSSNCSEKDVNFSTLHITPKSSIFLSSLFSFCSSICKRPDQKIIQQFYVLIVIGGEITKPDEHFGQNMANRERYRFY